MVDPESFYLENERKCRFDFKENKKYTADEDSSMTMVVILIIFEDKKIKTSRLQFRNNTLNKK